MKAILEFNIPEDYAAHQIAVNGGDFINAVNDFDNWLRDKLKHGDLTGSDYKCFDEIRDKLYEYLGDYNVKYLLDL